MGKKVDTRDFVTEAFDYLTTLEEVSINRSANTYLLEWIANGFASDSYRGRQSVEPFLLVRFI